MQNSTNEEFEIGFDSVGLSIRSEQVSDGISRRKHRNGCEYQYRIERKVQGEIFTAYFIAPVELIEDRAAFGEYAKWAFADCVAEAVRREFVDEVWFP